MTEGEFEALPYGSEGLWRKLMHASREKANLEDIQQSQERIWTAAEKIVSSLAALK